MPSDVRAVLALLAVACAPPSGPRFPADEAAAQRLIASGTRRPPEPHPGLDEATVIEAIDRGPVAAGWGPVTRALARHERWIVGVHHDARGQHEAFGRLFGPTGASRTLALELFDARGDWAGVSPREQAGDAAVLLAYHRAGGARRLERVRARLLRGGYTAWKYDLVDEVLSWVVGARGAQRSLVGCDAPPALLARMEGFDEATRLRLRELHCARALARIGSEPYAVLIGDAHAGPAGLPRFLDDAHELHLIGGRDSDAGLEARLEGRVQVASPTLVELPGRGRFALILPGPHLGLESDRSRGEVARPGVFFDPPTEARRDGDLLPRGRRLGPGDHALVFRRGDRRFVVGLEVADGARARVDATLDAPRIDVRVSGF